MKKRVFTLLLLPLSAMILLLVRSSSYVAEEIFAKRIYKVLSIVISSVTSIVPFSVAEMILLVGPILILFFIVRLVIRIIRGKGMRKTYILNFMLNVGCVISLIVFGYIMLCGVNYHRYSFSHYSGLVIEDSTEDELYGLCLDLTRRANDLREQITTVDENGAMYTSVKATKLAKEAKEAMNNLSKEYPILSGYLAKPKGILLSKYMSMTETTGIYIPWTVEANVNVDIPSVDIPVTMCHELAHLRGFMREDEANYIAYLACTTYDDIEIQYSGVKLALSYSMNQLYRKNPDRYFEVAKQYGKGLVADVIAHDEYWSQFEDTVVSTVSNKINDTYLKVNDQKDGTQSYGRMVDLLLAEYRKKQS